jgi:hypothetical protein
MPNKKRAPKLKAVEQESLEQDIIKELGLSELAPEKQQELLINMTEAVLQRIFVKTMICLSEAEQNEYADMVEQGTTAEDMDEFLKEKIPDYEEMVKKIINDFKEEMKKDIGI